jgi:hypothetical protein
MDENKKDEVTEFLAKMGMKDDLKPEENQWDRIIHPSFSYLLTGDVGTGKTGLAFWLLETYSEKYKLKPAVVGFQRPDLLPAHYMPLDLEELSQANDVIALIDEADIQLPIEDSKARKTVTNFLSLPRQRHQIFILSFHYPRLVMGRYLPFFGAFLFKRPPYLIEFASKNRSDAITAMMNRAEERFSELVPPNWQPSEGQLQPVEVIRSTYVVAPRIRWQGLITTPWPASGVRRYRNRGRERRSRRSPRARPRARRSHRVCQALTLATWCRAMGPKRSRRRCGAGPCVLRIYLPARRSSIPSRILSGWNIHDTRDNYLLGERQRGKEADCARASPLR